MGHSDDIGFIAAASDKRIKIIDNNAIELAHNRNFSITLTGFLSELSVVSLYQDFH